MDALLPHLTDLSTAGALIVVVYMFLRHNATRDEQFTSALDKLSDAIEHWKESK